MVQAHRENVATNLASWQTEPPAVLLYDPSRHNCHATPALERVERPDGFTPSSRRDYLHNSYSTLYHDRLAEMTRDLAATDATLARMRERLAAWRAPEAVA